MAWYNFKRETKEEHIGISGKLNPAQPYFSEKTANSREQVISYQAAYEDLEVVNRGVNMIVDDTSEINKVIGKDLQTAKVAKGVKKVSLNRLLNQEPNPFQDISTFRRNLITDYLIDGNMFIYYDGVHLYHLPASKMTIHASDKTYVSKYSFEERIDYSPNEIIHIKENSFYSIYRGTSRLKPALRTMILMKRMRDFQDNFFKNGAITGLVIKSPNTLSEKIKERMISFWQARYSPDSGGGRPLILDGGLEVSDLTKVNFRDLDFQNSIGDNERIILKALGVPPIMLDSGNNANLRPNMRMYYLETILPISYKVNKALERFFGFEITDDTVDIPALQPELRDLANYYTTLVNTGVISVNEARAKLGYEDMSGCDEVRIPVNIAGSAENPGEGGRPEEDTEDT